MWTSLEPIKVLRYLLVWRVNRSLVQLPPSFAADLSLVLGTIIADRLPTRKATPWRKCAFNHNVAKEAMIWLKTEMAMIWLKNYMRVDPTISMA